MEQSQATETQDTTVAEGAEQQPRQAKWRVIAPLVVFDILAPLGSYYVLHAFGVSDVIALTAGGLIAGLRAVYTVIRDRKIDGFAVFVLSMFALGLGMAFVTGDPRFVLAKDSFGMGFAGLVMLGSCLLGKPFTYYSGKRFYKGGTPEAVAEWEERYRTLPAFRINLVRVAVIWGIGLVAIAAIVIALVYQLPIATMVTVSNVVHIGGILVLILITRKLVMRARRATAQG
ncbi:VC0807 family protein [Sciscionella marina]|uniref:VC0807 family protein n=1 Tax=Sciscionella marina TaxID=508770 RepID=UPI00037A1B0B|nr:VC0807 family protein [Sciscionella marina]